MSEHHSSSHQDLPVYKTSSIVPQETSLGEGLPSERVNSEVHGLIDEPLKKELSEGMIDGDDKVIELAIPPEAVPFDGSAIYDELKDSNGQPLYDDKRKRWRNFPGHNNSRQSIPDFLEILATAVHDIVKKDNPERKRRHWSSIYEKHPVPHPHTDRQPDGVQVCDDLSGIDITNPSVDRSMLPNWGHISSTIEFKTKTGKGEAILQDAGGARMIFNSQLDRRYVLGYTIIGEDMTLIVFDRSGWVASRSFDIHSNPDLLLHVAVGSLYLDEEKYGLDPTIRLRDDKRQIQVGEDWYDIVDVIHVEGVLRGRATICYHVRKDGVDYVVKDCWVDRTRVIEADILKKLQGVPHVPEIVANEPVLFNGAPDTTGYFRHGAEHSYEKTEIREHRRIVLKPFARKLSDFRTLVELITAIRDVLDGIQGIYEKGFIHRDISIANVMLEEKDGDYRGLLIDYDYAISKDKLEVEALGRRTGTLPFMAIEILEGKPNTIHSFKHDLESLFYVLVWICTMQNGPCGELREPGFQYKKSVLSIWNGGIHNTTIPFTVVSMAKRSSMSSAPQFEADIMDNFASYFDPLKECVESLREKIFVTPGTQKQQDAVKMVLEQPQQIVNQTVVGLLQSFLPVGTELFDSLRGILNEHIERLKEGGHHLPRPRPTNPSTAALQNFFVLHPVDLGILSYAEVKAGNDKAMSKDWQKVANFLQSNSRRASSSKRQELSDSTPDSSSSKRMKKSHSGPQSYVEVSRPTSSRAPPSSYEFIAHHPSSSSRPGSSSK